ncbi:MAG: SCO family protein [Verrucomicrobiae bacterium]|nr:SCO family protein [Verrucomicrobiae bacterium]
MQDRPERLSRTLWIGVGLLIVILCATYVLSRLEPQRPGPRAVLGVVADFTLTNQFGAPVSLADLRGFVWVADIIFTRCAGPCPRMTQQMKALQDALPPDSRVRLITLTTDPDFDTPPVLRAYAERFGADPKRWWFLTGNKQQIAALAIDSLKLTTLEKKPEERESPADLFIHATTFVLVDKHGRLRDVFETTGEDVDPTIVQAQILARIRQLERER